MTKLQTSDQYFAEWNGRKHEVAGPNADNECVDNANGHMRDVDGQPIIEHANAIDFPTRAGDAYVWIERKTGVYPRKGDYPVWDSSVGRNGHIDICAEDGDENGFLGFDQNWPLDEPCGFVRHTYNGIMGWLRLKSNDNDVTQEQQQKLDAAYALVEAVKAGCESLRQRNTDGALFADADVLGKDPDALRRTIWADSQALAIIMRMAGIPQITEEESKKDKYVRVQSARQFDDKK